MKIHKFLQVLAEYEIFSPMIFWARIILGFGIIFLFTIEIYVVGTN